MVQEAKEKELIKCGKELQKDFLGNRRNFWKKVRGKEVMHKWSLGIENEEGTLLTEQREVRNRCKDYFRGLLDGEGRDVDTRTGSAERDRNTYILSLHISWPWCATASNTRHATSVVSCSNVQVGLRLSTLFMHCTPLWCYRECISINN